jgi:hypothetical protein
MDQHPVPPMHFPEQVQEVLPDKFAPDEDFLEYHRQGVFVE